MKKSYIFLLILLLTATSLSNAYAYDALLDRFLEYEKLTGTAIQEETPIEYDPFRKEVTFSIDSFQFLGEHNENAQLLIQILNGLKFLFSYQTGAIPTQSYKLTIGENQIFSYNGQFTAPYYVNSNLLGDKTYLIYPEDRFEEKVASSFYSLTESFSGSVSGLPEIESVYAMIEAFRESSQNNRVSQFSTGFAYDQEIKTSAFEPFRITLLSKLEDTEPNTGSSYFFTDIPRWNRKYTWPESVMLPSLPVPVTALSAVYTSEDIAAFFDTLPQFFMDNPEVKTTLNQQIQAGFVKSNPELADAEGIDYLDELITEMKASVLTDLNNIVISVKIDQDEAGDPILTAIEIGETDSNGVITVNTIIKWRAINDGTQSLSETAVDVYEKSIKKPLFRMLSVKTPTEDDAGTNTVNFWLNSGDELKFEYAQSTNYYLSPDFVRVSDSEIRFDLNGESGLINLSGNAAPNEFGKENTISNITYAHTSQGIPLFSASMSLESIFTAPTISIPVSEAVPASQLSESDYNQIASNILLQFMMLTIILN